MFDFLLLVLFIITLGVLPIIMVNFRVVYYLQRYNFSPKRLWYFLKSENGKMIFFDPWLIIYVIVFWLFAIDYFWIESHFFFVIAWLLVILQFLNSLLITIRFLKHDLLVPTLSYRTISLLWLTFFGQLIVFLWWYFYQHILIWAFILLVFPYIIIFLSNLILLPWFILWKILLQNKIKQKLLNANNHHKVLFVWSYAKSSLLHLSTQIFSKQKFLTSSIEFPHFIWLLQSLQQLKKDTSFGFYELWLYKYGDSVKFCQLLNPQTVFFSGFEPQHIWYFNNNNDLIKEKLNFLKLLDKWSRIYVNNNIPSNIKNILVSSSHKIIFYGMEDDNIHARCFILNLDHAEHSHAFSYNGDYFLFKSPLSTKSSLINLAGILAFYIDSWYKFEDIKESLTNLKHPEQLILDYDLWKKISVVEKKYDYSIAWLFDMLTHIKENKKYIRPYILIFDWIKELGKVWNQIHFDIGKKMAWYPIEKIFLVDKWNRSYIKKGLIDAGFDNQKIFFEWDLGILKNMKEWTILVKWEHSQYKFKKIFS